MPDFDLVSTWTCASNFYCERHIQGSKGDLYVVHWGRLPEPRIMETGAQRLTEALLWLMLLAMPPSKRG